MPVGKSCNKLLSKSIGPKKGRRSNAMDKTYDAIIVGAGLAGLACARTLHQRGLRIVVLEASPRIGGRLRTEEVNGFSLDYGFQVLLTSYPTAEKLLDFQALRLGAFVPGARIYDGKMYQSVVDPLRTPSKLMQTLFSNVGTLGDKLKILSLRKAVQQPETLGESLNLDTLTFLQRRGFTDSFIERFFKPFYGGVFLEQKLETSAHVFAYTFDRFSNGLATIPAGGMSKIPEQLAVGLSDEIIHRNTEVIAVTERAVHTKNGSIFKADNIVLAAPFHVTDALLNRPNRRAWKSTSCLYFSTKHPPISEPILALNGSADGLVNLVCVPSLVTADLAPHGQQLICVSLRNSNDEIQPSEIMRELEGWFGDSVNQWQHLKTFHVKHALPCSTTLDLESRPSSTLPPHLHVCGDHTELATIEHALKSGLLAAERITS